MMLTSISLTGTMAQTATERIFAEKIDSLNEFFYVKEKENKSKDCETISRSLIELYEEYSDKLSEGCSYFKFARYYNLACIQARQGNKDEAATSPLSTLK